MKNQKSTAVFCKTESGDDYLYSLTGHLTKEEAREFLKEELGEEYNYICELKIAHSE